MNDEKSINVLELEQPLSLNEKINVINRIACTGDEFMEGFAKLEQLQAIITCVMSYCEDILNGVSHHYITAMLRLGESITNETEKYFSDGIQAIIDTIKEE